MTKAPLPTEDTLLALEELLKPRIIQAELGNTVSRTATDIFAEVIVKRKK